MNLSVIHLFVNVQQEAMVVKLNLSDVDRRWTSFSLVGN